MYTFTEKPSGLRGGRLSLLAWRLSLCFGRCAASTIVERPLLGPLVPQQSLLLGLISTRALYFIVQVNLRGGRHLGDDGGDVLSIVRVILFLLLFLCR